MRSDLASIDFDMETRRTILDYLKMAGANEGEFNSDSIICDTGIKKLATWKKLGIVTSERYRMLSAFIEGYYIGHAEKYAREQS